MLKLALTSAAALLIAAGALAQGAGEADPQAAASPASTGATAEAAAAPVEAPPEDRVICRTERVTGSRTRRTRICMTQSEWAELERNTMHNMNEFNRGASGGQCVASDPTRSRC